MAIKYLYIDDNLGKVVDGQVSGLNTNKDELEVVHKQPAGDWEKEREYLIKGDFSKTYDGLIIDLRLDDEINSNGDKSNYKGTTLSQELRTLSTENVAKEIPIILLSATEKIDASLDSTGEDLFDLRIHKEKLRGSFIDITRMRLISLAIGYKLIVDLKEMTITEFLKRLFNQDVNFIDTRFISKISSLQKKPAHTLVAFVLKYFIESDGILLHEKTLAARLGIEINSEDWPKLLQVFGQAKYSGIFSEGWERWWSFEIGRILQFYFEDDGLKFRNLSAEKRTGLIKEKTGLKNLTPVTRLEYAQSDTFWTVCIGTERPLDPIDGIIIANQDNLFPWQEKKYISIYEALTRKNKPKWGEIAVLETDRLARLQKLYSRDRG